MTTTVSLCLLTIEPQGSHRTETVQPPILRSGERRWMESHKPNWSVGHHHVPRHERNVWFEQNPPTIGGEPHAVQAH